MAIAPTSFLYEVDEATSVATITLNRPDRLNALTFEVYEELRDTFVALSDEPGVRSVIITGAGRAFCTGGDVEDIIGALFDLDYPGLLRFTRLTGSLIGSIRRCSKPVVAALNGTVAGAGAVIAAACDFRVANQWAKIGFLFTKVGLAGADMGAAWLLPRLVGQARATQILMLGDFVSPSDAVDMGLYNVLVEEGDEVVAEARRIAVRLAQGPSLALGLTKELLNREASMDLDSALELEAQIQAVCMQDPNFLEFYEAFRDKRTPVFG